MISCVKPMRFELDREKTHSLTQARTYVKTFQINRNSCENVFLIEIKGRSKKTRQHTHARTLPTCERASARESFQLAKYHTSLQCIHVEKDFDFLTKSSGNWWILRFLLLFCSSSMFCCGKLRVCYHSDHVRIDVLLPVISHTKQVKKANNYRFKIDIRCD